MVYHVPDVRARGLPQRVAMATDERGRGMKAKKITKYELDAGDVAIAFSAFLERAGVDMDENTIADVRLGLYNATVEVEAGDA